MRSKGLQCNVLKKNTMTHQCTLLAPQVYFWVCMQIILSFEQITLNEFFVLVAQHRQIPSVSSAARMVLLIHVRTLASVELKDDEVFTSDMTDIGLQFHEPDATPIPVTFLPFVLQKFATIEPRAE